MTVSPLRVLYVDDDKDIRQIVTLAMSLDPGIELRSAGSGAEALALLAEGVWQPDIALLDVMMPGMTGPQVMQAMRETLGLTEIPYAFITAMGREPDVASYRELGAVEVILKPFDPITLAARVREIATK